MATREQISASYDKLFTKRAVWFRPIGSMYYWYRFKRGNMLTLCHEEGHWYRANYNRVDYKFICYNITTAKRIAVFWARRLKR